MPECSRCRMLVDGHCTAHDIARKALERPIPPPPSGACMIPIVESYLELIKPGTRVLEVGCGSWDQIKRHCQRVGAHYEGIDTQAEYFGKKSGATRIENLAELSYPDETFDLVIGNQTMEHWGEYGCSLSWGIYQCFRVCKTGGQVLLNVPIHFHGTRQFLLGEFSAIQRAFKPFSTRVSLEKWGEPSRPLPPYYAHPNYWLLRNKGAYVVDIRAVKDRPLPRGYSNRWGMRGRISQIFNLPVTYNFHRVLAKLIK